MAVLAAAIALAVHRIVLARREGAPPLTTTLLRALPITAAALAVVSLVAIARMDRGQPPERGGVLAGGGQHANRRGRPFSMDWFSTMVIAGRGTADAAGGDGAAPEPNRAFPYLLVAIVAIAVAGGAAVWLRARSEPAAPPGHDDVDGSPDAEGVRDTVIGTIDAMLADPDPNTAIRGAYARLLEGLAACGTGRRDHEAPEEHLHRVLTLSTYGPHRCAS